MRKVDFVNDTRRKKRLTKRAWLKEFVTEKKRSIKVFLVSTGALLFSYQINAVGHAWNNVETWAHHLLFMTVPEIIPKSAWDTQIPKVLNDQVMQAKWEKLFCKLDNASAEGVSLTWLRSKFDLLGDPIESTENEDMHMKEFLNAVKTKSSSFYENFKESCAPEL